MVDIVERINVLLEQERCWYLVPPKYDAQTTHIAPTPEDQAQFAASEVRSSSSSSTSSNIDIWRERICEWSFQVTDHFDFSREVVAVAVNYLDRYLSAFVVDKLKFQLLGMACLHLAIKLYEPGPLSMKSMVVWSRGFFSEKQMEEMEMKLVSALGWRLHPPTAYCFSRHLLILLPSGCISLELRYELLELARFLTELSVVDYFFVGHRPSAIAMAALLNAMDTIPRVAPSVKEDLLTELRAIPPMFLLEDEVEDCRQRLSRLYGDGGHNWPNPDEVERKDVVSPTCVSQVGVNMER